MTFGLRDNAGIGDANCDSTSCPNQLLLVGAGLVVLALVYRRRLVAL